MTDSHHMSFHDITTDNMGYKTVNTARCAMGDARHSIHCTDVAADRLRGNVSILALVTSQGAADWDSLLSVDNTWIKTKHNNLI